MSAAANSLPSGAGRNALALRRVHARGATMLLLGVLAGVAVFACTAGLQTRAKLATGSAAGDLISWVNALPVERSHPITSGDRPSLVLTSENRGRVLFGRYCDSCHYGGNENIGSSLRDAQFKRTYTTPEKIAEYVRRGGFDMPAFSRAFLSDADLDAIAAYVRTLPEATR